MPRPSRSSVGRSLLSAIGGTLLAAGVAVAGDVPGRNTVFRGEAGDSWTVSIKPARRTAQAEPQAVPVPPPAEVVVPAAAEVVSQPEGEPPVELPATPVLTIGQPGTGASMAHGVTVVPDAEQRLIVFGRRYEDAYRSVPFNRAEYDANPSYRHEAAMEILFGQLRPTTVVKHMPAPKDDEPAYSPYKPYLPAYGDYSSFRSLPNPYPLFRYDNINVPGGCFWPGY